MIFTFTNICLKLQTNHPGRRSLFEKNCKSPPNAFARKMYQTFCKFFSICILKDKKAWNFASNKLLCFELSFL